MASIFETLRASPPGTVFVVKAPPEELVTDDPEETPIVEIEKLPEVPADPPVPGGGGGETFFERRMRELEEAARIAATANTKTFEERFARPLGGITSPRTRAAAVRESRAIPFFSFGDIEPFIDMEFEAFLRQVRGDAGDLLKTSIPGLSQWLCYLLNCQEKDFSTETAAMLNTTTAGAHVFMTLLFVNVPVGGKKALEEMVDWEISLAIERGRLEDIQAMAEILIEPGLRILPQVAPLFRLIPGAKRREAAIKKADQEYFDKLLRKLDRGAATITGSLTRKRRRNGRTNN